MSAEKIQWFFPKIITWFEKNQRTGLPWRQPHRNPYEVWVSEIMLQQTQVSRVIPFYERFLKRFPTIQLLAKASWEEFLPYYQGLGYYSRGRNMLKTARLIAEQYGGQFPQEKAALLALPGIGEYTANAILSFAFEQSVLTFDTNHQRVWGRFLKGDKRATIPSGQILEQFPPAVASRQFNEAMMDFANTVCTSTQPDCAHCPVSRYCQYFLTAGKLEAARKTKKSTFPVRSAAALVILHDNNRQFYSLRKNKFQPFFVPAAMNSRSGVKQYFQEKYGLAVSVRPPFRKTFDQKQPVLLVRAQVLLGNHRFSSYPKTAYQQWLKTLPAGV